MSKASGATIREVDMASRDGAPTRIVRARRLYEVSQDTLWAAVSEKERLVRWFADISGDLEIGGHFSIKGNADGTIIACNPPDRFILTWEFGGTTSWVSVTIEPTKDESMLTLTHELPTDRDSEAHWAEYGPGATGVGWDLAFLGLDMHFLGDGGPSRDAGAAWAGTDDGKSSLRAWSRAWAEADVKAGTPAQTARDMADRTAAFYTSEG